MPEPGPDVEEEAIAYAPGSARVSVRESARGMCEAIVDFQASGSPLEEIRLVLWDENHFGPFEKALRRARRAKPEFDV